MNLGQLIDQRHDLKQEYSRAQAVVDDLEKQVKDLETQIRGAMADAGVDMAAGTKGKVTLREEKQPQVFDWDQFYAYIRDNNAFYLLQKRVTATAYRESINAGEEIPGVNAVPVKSLSFTTL